LKNPPIPLVIDVSKLNKKEFEKLKKIVLAR